ncbi:hypothetical protein F5B20DRAFT_555548 [Whalleya microplaca]|nr:hypothetical protein F5B20DRAFT_555548 [Whalleya microplaca]
MESFVQSLQGTGNVTCDRPREIPADTINSLVQELQDVVTVALSRPQEFTADRVANFSDHLQEIEEITADINTNYSQWLRGNVIRYKSREITTGNITNSAQRLQDTGIVTRFQLQEITADSTPNLLDLVVKQDNSQQSLRELRISELVQTIRGITTILLDDSSDMGLGWVWFALMCRNLIPIGNEVQSFATYRAKSIRTRYYYFLIIYLQLCSLMFNLGNDHQPLRTAPAILIPLQHYADDFLEFIKVGQEVLAKPAWKATFNLTWNKYYTRAKLIAKSLKHNATLVLAEAETEARNQQVDRRLDELSGASQERSRLLMSKQLYELAACKNEMWKMEAQRQEEKARRQEKKARRQEEKARRQENEARRRENEAKQQEIRLTTQEPQDSNYGAIFPQQRF